MEHLRSRTLLAESTIGVVHVLRFTKYLKLGASHLEPYQPWTLHRTFHRWTWRCEVWILLDYGPGRRGGRCRRRLHWRSRASWDCLRFLTGVTAGVCSLKVAVKASSGGVAGSKLRGRVQLCGCHGLHIHGEVHRSCAVQRDWIGAVLHGYSARFSARGKMPQVNARADQNKTCGNKTALALWSFTLRLNPVICGSLRHVHNHKSQQELEHGSGSGAMSCAWHGHPVL